MGRRLKVALGTIAAIAVVTASSVGVGRLAFERRMSREVANLFAARHGAAASIVTEADLAELPEPVQRWLRDARVVGTKRPSAVRLKQTGEFRLSEDRDWMSFSAQQYFALDPPGFVWTARFEMAPHLPVIGRDRYAGGTGDIEMRLFGVIPVADKTGGGLDQGALLRYLGESVWFPAAVLSPYITWEPIDHNSAKATMSHGGQTASATFIFDEQGRPAEVRAERYNDEKGRLESWSIPLRAYGDFEQVIIPVAGEGIWEYDSGDFTYIRWQVTEVEYDEPSRFP
jgi:hypothetical protein